MFLFIIAIVMSAPTAAPAQDVAVVTSVAKQNTANSVVYKAGKPNAANSIVYKMGKWDKANSI
jgi:hypothetical protein